jgi:DNA-binding LytR/AlgR family response regulator
MSVTATNNKTKVFLNRKNKKVVFSEEIMYLEGVVNYTVFHLSSEQKITTARTLKAYSLHLINEGFIRVHRAFLVNTHFIKSYNELANEVVLLNGTTLKVSRRMQKNLKW